MRDLVATLGRLSAIGAVLLVTGCGKPADESLSEQAFRQDPRRTFERIVNHFKHQYTGGAIAVPTRVGGDGAKRRLLLRFMVEDVRYTVRGCDRLSDPCTAEMTVKTSTHSSLQRVSPPSGETPTSSREKGRGETGRRGDHRVNGSATTGAGNRKGRLSDALAAESVLRKQNKSREQTCYFSYEDGHWVLTGQLADSSMQRAIEFALARQ